MVGYIQLKRSFQVRITPNSVRHPLSMVPIINLSLNQCAVGRINKDLSGYNDKCPNGHFAFVLRPIGPGFKLYSFHEGTGLFLQVIEIGDYFLLGIRRLCNGKFLRDSVVYYLPVCDRLRDKEEVITLLRLGNFSGSLFLQNQHFSLVFSFVGCIDLVLY